MEIIAAKFMKFSITKKFFIVNSQKTYIITMIFEKQSHLMA